jgi:hypothetical protein
VTDDDKNENAEQELENLYKKFEHEGVKVFAPDEFAGLSPEEEILGNDITMPSSDVDLAEDNDASVEQLSETSNKNKIESNVNIDIGSGTKVTDGFMNIPLTVSPKPSELDAPPKKKRGRPPKKKKNKI